MILWELLREDSWAVIVEKIQPASEDRLRMLSWQQRRSSRQSSCFYTTDFTCDARTYHVKVSLWDAGLGTKA